MRQGPEDGFVLGVDLGTSHTVAMLRRPDGRTRPLLFDGQPLLPSAVYLDTTGRIHVGRDALRLGYAEPARFEPHPKRRIDDRSVLLGGAEVPVAALLAALLGAVAREAVAATGFLPPAVLTYPAAWGEQRRAVLIEAIAQAGWPAETRLVPEPVAAARYFAEVLRRPLPVGSALAVFDLGGGTLDVAVVRNEGLTPEGLPRLVVAASGGADDLGGLDLDAALVEHLGKSLAGAEPQAWSALTEPVTLAQWRARRQFWDDVRGAKEMLSRSAFAPVAVPGVEQAVQLSQAELEGAAGALVRRGVAEAETVITAAGLTARELAGLFLVGGSSRVPLVARLLHGELGIAPTVLEQPELPVAEGAIIAAGAAGAAGSSSLIEPAGEGEASAGRLAQGGQASGATPALPAPPPLQARPPIADTSPQSVRPPMADTSPEQVRPTAADNSLQSGRPPADSSLQVARPGVVVTPPQQGRGPDAVPGSEPHYGEPVDPWATGEAAAFGAAGAAQPWLASAHPDGHGPIDGSGRSGAAAAYKKRFWGIVAAATVVVLGVAATLIVVFWPGHPALKFHPLGTALHVTPAVPLGSSFSAVAVRDGRAYFASTDDSPQGNQALGVVAADTATGKALWSEPSVAGADQWEQLVATPEAVVAFSARDYSTSTRLMVVLDARTGQRLWTKTLDGDDTVMFTGQVAVQVDVPGKRLVGLGIRDGRQIWTHANPVDQYQLATAALIKSTTVADDSGPAATDGTAFAAPLDDNDNDDNRIVQIGADNSATVIDGRTGSVLRRLTNVADPGDDVIAHNGRLIVAEASDGRQVVEFDLDKTGQPKVLYNPPDDQTRTTHLAECGDDRVCFVTTGGSGDATAKIVAVDAAKGGVLWSRQQTGVQELVPVGDSVLAVQDSPAQVTLLDPKGHVTWTMAGAAARLDAGNVLLFAKALSTGLDDPSLAGLHLGDKAVQLGPMSGVKPSTCAWDTEVIACAGEKDFQIREFAG